MLINRVGGFGVLFLSLYLVNERGLGASGAGLIVGLAGIGGAAGSLAGGVLADRWGRRRTLLTGHLLLAASMAALAFTPWLPAIAVLTCLIGVFQSMAGPAMVAAIIDVVPVADRQRAFNLQFWAFNLGMAAASLLAGLLAEIGFALLFSLDAVATLLAFLVLAIKVPETLTHRDGPAPADRSGLGTALRDRSFMTFVGLTLLVATVFTQASTILPLAMKDDGLSGSAYGVVTAFAGALIVVGQLFVPALIGGREKGRVLACAAAFLGLGFSIIALADGLAVYLVAAFVWTIGSMLAAPPNAEVIAELSPAALRARYQAVFYIVFPLAAFISPALGGFGLEHLGNGNWIICGMIGVAAALGHLGAGRSRERLVRARRDAEKDSSGVPAAVQG
ncbi:MFS transporter [Actinocorallia longicatena]